MSEEKKEISLLEQMKKQHQMYCGQRDQTQANFQQLVGAIFALEHMIKLHEEELKKQFEDIANQSQGASEDGEAKSENQEQIAQE